MKNFAGQPDGGGEITILTGMDLKTDIQPSTFDKRIFYKHPNFVDNCKDCGDMKKNAVGDTTDTKSGISWGNVFDTVKTGFDVWTTTQAQKSAEEQAQLALEIEKARLAQEKAKAEQEKARASSMSEKIKAYGIPIAITGAVVIASIAAYFYFKKKKVG